jgi:hypothetical protein
MGKHAIYPLSWSTGHTGYPKMEHGFNQAGEHIKFQILELEQWRDKAYHCASIYKERTKRWHDIRLKPKVFNPGDKVLLLNSRVKLFGHGKLWSKWLGPYLVVDTSTHEAITIQDEEGNLHKVNGHRLKHFLEHDNVINEDIDMIEIVDHENLLD